MSHLSTLDSSSLKADRFVDRSSADPENELLQQEAAFWVHEAARCGAITDSQRIRYLQILSGGLAYEQREPGLPDAHWMNVPADETTLHLLVSDTVKAA